MAPRLRSPDHPAFTSNSEYLPAGSGRFDTRPDLFLRSAPVPPLAPSNEELRSADCLETVDRVGDPATASFKAAARLHQARWREAKQLPIGTQPISGGSRARPLGSRLPLAYALESYANFIDPRCAQAARARLAAPQRHQMLKADRLYADLLSSMPMCFNLFGTITEPAAATAALRAWWPDVPGSVSEVIFEWSPGRADRAYLGNRTSFDVAFILDLGEGRRGVLGVETKYHEHPIPVGATPENLPRYLEVARASELFEESALAALPRDTVSQLWLDHLLALSMLQHRSGQWHWARFALVYPDGNPAWAPLVARYRALLRDEQTFAALTFDQLIAAGALEAPVCDALIARYRCW